ncbi:MAG: hypothetical protein WC506_02880 [Candidatus Micrarchaeia archaeon]
MEKTNPAWRSCLAIAAILVTLQAASFAQVQFQTATGTFNSPRAVNENFMTDTIISGSFTAASTGQRILMEGADPNNLPNEAYICPGTVNFAIQPQIFWAPSQFATTSPYPVNIARAPAGNVNDRNVPIQFDTGLFQSMTAGTIYPSDSLFASVLAPGQEDVGYINITGSQPVIGRSHDGLVCTGTYTINGNSNDLSSPISGGAIGQPTATLGVSFPASSLGPKTVNANVAISQCKGVVGTFVEDVGADRLRKYVFSGNTNAASSSSAQFSLTIADPHAIAPTVNSVLPNPINIAQGESVNVTFTITNNDPVSIQLTDATATNGFVITGLAGWTDPISPESVAKRNATITSTAGFSGSFNITLGFSTAVPVCDGTTLTATANTTQTNSGPVSCQLNSSALQAVNYNVSRGGIYPVEARCFNGIGVEIPCGSGFTWTTNLTGGAMQPDATPNAPYISSLNVSLTAPNQTGRDIVATYTGSPSFNCSLMPQHPLTVGPDSNASSCLLSCPALQNLNYVAEIGSDYQIQAICFNQFNIQVPCNSNFIWGTNIINATMDPNTTISPVDTSWLRISATAPVQFGKNVTVNESSQNRFMCAFPGGVNVTYAKACTVTVPQQVFVGSEVAPTAEFTFPFNANITADCGNSQQITLECKNNTATGSQTTTCLPRSADIDKCKYASIGSFVVTATYAPTVCQGTLKAIDQTSTCNYYI